MRALKFSASAPIVVRASTPMRMPLIVRKLRSLWRATLRMISIGGAMRIPLARPRCGDRPLARRFEPPVISRLQRGNQRSPALVYSPHRAERATPSLAAAGGNQGSEAIMVNEGRIEISGRFPIPLEEVMFFIDNALHDASLCGCSHRGDWYTMTYGLGFEDEAEEPQG